MDFLIYSIMGAFTGILSGLFGIGGGILIVPGLAIIFSHLQAKPDTILHLAAGTSFAIMIVTASSSIRAHYRSGNMVWGLSKKMLPGILTGVIFGAVAAQHLHSAILSKILGVFLLGVAVNMVIKNILQLESNKSWPAQPIIFCVTLCMGILSGMLGIGAGSLIIPFLLRFGTPLPQVSGITIVCMLPIAIIGAASFIVTGWGYDTGLPYTTGYVYWPAFLAIALASSLTAPIGVKIAKHYSTAVLKNAFIVLLSVLAIDMLVFK